MWKWYNNDRKRSLATKEIVYMNEQVKEYIDKFSSEIIDMYNNLRQMIFDSVS